MIDFQALRNKILDKAIRGELVPQLESEPDVIQNREAPERPPFDIPEKWQWIQVKTLEVKRRTVNPGSLTCDKVELWSIPAYDKGNAQIVSPSDIGSSKKIVFAGDVLLAKIVPHIKRAWTVTEHCSDLALTKLASTEWLTYRSELFIPDFLVLLFKSPYFREKMIESVSGMGSLKRATPKALSKIWLPLPPQKEQHRILDRLNSLLTEINRVEIAYTELLTLGDIFRKQVLQKAIQGKLVPQLVSEPEVKQIGEVPKDIPFAIPEKWSWIRLGELVNYGSSKQIEGFKITASTWVLDLEDVEKNSGKLLQKKYGTKTTSNKSCFKKGDVLYGKLRPYLNKVLIADEDGCCTTEIIPISVSSAKLKLDAEFLCYFLRSPYFIEYANSCAYGVKMPRLGTKDAKAALVPIPPFQEQQRIVRRLKQLFTLITDLE